MCLDNIKEFLQQISNDASLLENDHDIIDNTIHEIIRAEKKYSYGLDMTTQHNRQDEIERIVLTAIEAVNNENKKN